jgi:hypothetical protein
MVESLFPFPPRRRDFSQPGVSRRLDNLRAGVMASKPKQPAGEPMTLGNMREHGDPHFHDRARSQFIGGQF